MPASSLAGSRLAERAVSDNRHQRAGRRGDFDRLKIARQRSAALQLPLADHARRQIRLVVIVPRPLGRTPWQ